MMNITIIMEKVNKKMDIYIFLSIFYTIKGRRFDVNIILNFFAFFVFLQGEAEKP